MPLERGKEGAGFFSRDASPGTRFQDGMATNRRDLPSGSERNRTSSARTLRFYRPVQLSSFAALPNKLWTEKTKNRRNLMFRRRESGGQPVKLAVLWDSRNRRGGPIAAGFWRASGVARQTVLWGCRRPNSFEIREKHGVVARSDSKIIRCQEAVVNGFNNKIQAILFVGKKLGGAAFFGSQCAHYSFLQRHRLQAHGSEMTGASPRAERLRIAQNQAWCAPNLTPTPEKQEVQTQKQ